MAHHDLASPDRADRHPAADDLSERGQVRVEVEHRLVPAPRNSEAHDLVGDQQRPVAVGERARAGEERRVARDHALTEHGFEDQRRDALTALGHHLLERAHVVEGHHVYELAHERWHSGAADRHLAVVCARAHDASKRHRHLLPGAVIAPDCLHDLHAAGVRTRHPDRLHDRLGARVRETHHLDGAHTFNNPFGEVRLQSVGSREDGTKVGLLGNCRNDLGVGVSVYQCGVVVEEVDEVVAVDVPYVAARAACKRERVRRVVGHRTRVACRQHATETLGQLARLGRVDPVTHVSTSLWETVAPGRRARPG